MISHTLLGGGLLVASQTALGNPRNYSPDDFKQLCAAHGVLWQHPVSGVGPSTAGAATNGGASAGAGAGAGVGASGETPRPSPRAVLQQEQQARSSGRAGVALGMRFGLNSAGLTRLYAHMGPHSVERDLAVLGFGAGASCLGVCAEVLLLSLSCNGCAAPPPAARHTQ